MMTLNARKERFSMAYISAVAAHAGYQIVPPAVDDDSVDGYLISREGTRPIVPFQAKATTVSRIRNGRLRFPLPFKNYNDLRAMVAWPRILIVVRLPSDETDWLLHSEEGLLVRHSGYWLSLEGQPETTNVRSVTVSIPQSQVFNTEQLRQIMGRADRKERL
jgi:hypothetical protein